MKSGSMGVYAAVECRGLAKSRFLMQVSGSWRRLWKMVEMGWESN